MALSTPSLIAVFDTLADAVAAVEHANRTNHQDYTALYRFHAEIVGEGAERYIEYRVVRYTIGGGR